MKHSLLETLKEKEQTKQDTTVQLQYLTHKQKKNCGRGTVSRKTTRGLKLVLAGLSRWLSCIHIRLMIRRLVAWPLPGRQHSFVEIDREIFSTVILSLPLIQEGQLPVSGERMCTKTGEPPRGLSLSCKSVVNWLGSTWPHVVHWDLKTQHKQMN